MGPKEVGRAQNLSSLFSKFTKNQHFNLTLNIDPKE